MTIACAFLASIQMMMTFCSHRRRQTWAKQDAVQNGAAPYTFSMLSSRDKDLLEIFPVLAKYLGRLRRLACLLCRGLCLRLSLPARPRGTSTILPISRTLCGVPIVSAANGTIIIINIYDGEIIHLFLCYRLIMVIMATTILSLFWLFMLNLMV